MNDLSTSRTAAWAQAVSAHQHLLQPGNRLRRVTPPPTVIVEAGEDVVGVIPDGLTFARHGRAQVMASGATTVLVGPPSAAAGFLVSEFALRGYRRRQAQRAAAPRWWPALLRHTVITSRRLWCEIITDTGSRWLHFAYDTIVDTGHPILAGDVLTLTFLDAEPLQIRGDLAPWCAAVIAHFRFGQDAPRHVPTLHGTYTLH
ncbi:hypothetical protein [Amycolatopsis tolypomycina]|uniref:hypothetical protein n=1 Tax=Amycolatopsis tolypomycina TaxID=208445 RepID=UPI0033A883F5